MGELTFRFVMGGLAVALFSVGGDLFKLRSLGGLFGAAPSVALATMGLAFAKEGSGHVAMQARSMFVAAVALGLYACLVARLMRRTHLGVGGAILLMLPSWFAVSFWGWCVLKVQ